MAGEEIRIGVYTCMCGGNISDTISCDRLARNLGKEPGVVVSRHFLAMCADSGQALIENDIRELGVNRVVIGACAPSLHAKTFRGTCARAGLNPYLYYHVGLREQLSWVHANDPERACWKAFRLMRTGIAKVRLLKPLSPILLEAGKHALVIGGGVSGLRAARQISKRGLKVTLVEKSPFLGGRMAQLEETFPHGTPARDELHPLIAEVLSDPNIEVHTGTEVPGVKGYIGDFSVTARRVPRGVSDDAGDLKEAMRVCPVTVSDEFNYGLTDRKPFTCPTRDVIPPFRPSTGELHEMRRMPESPGGQSIRLDGEAESLQLGVGAIVVATGFNPTSRGKGVRLRADPRRDDASRVHPVPGLEPGREGAFVRRAAGPPHRFRALRREPPHRRRPRPDGGRQGERLLLPGLLHRHAACGEGNPGKVPRNKDLRLPRGYPRLRARARGYLHRGVEQGVFFLRFHGDQLPAAEPGTDGDGRILVRTVDHLTDGMEVETAVDLLVLAVGFLPAPGVIDWDVGEEERRDLAKLLKINPGAGRFLQEVHPKLRPVETAVSGIVLAGAAQGPMNIQESCAAASAAAAKVAVLLSRGQVELEPFVAVSIPRNATGPAPAWRSASTRTPSPFGTSTGRAGP
jgi:heterodisulfide reductase subunit A